MCGTSSYHGVSWAHNCLLILLFVVGYCSGNNDCSVLEPTVEPTIQYVPLGNESKIYTCHGMDFIQHWIIDDEDVRQNMDTIDNLMQRGFSFDWMPNISMTINATMSNNDTKIMCEVLGTKSCVSKAARFIVIGAPSSPELHWEAVNATQILVSWNTPFTWPNYSILQYNIIITNTSTGQEIVNVHATESDDKVKYYTSIEMIAQSCIELMFTVTVSNALGWSDPGITTGGFPIRTPGSFTSSVTAEVYFKSDGTPIANVTFELPHMCTYQTLQYTIVICNLTTESNNPFDVGPKEYLYSQGSSVSEVLESQLVSNALYSIVAVTVQTAAGNSTSNDSAIFNTTVTLNQTTTDATVTLNQTTTDTTVTLYQTTTDATVTLNQTTTDQRLTVIVAAAVGSTSAAVLLLVAAGIAIAKAVVRTRKHEQGGHTRSVSVAQSAMVPNPIYEGPMYETIVPQNFDALAANVESETLELRYLANPILPARSGGETNAIIAPVTDNASATPRSDDNYTVMSPIGSHSISSLMNKANQDAENQ